MKSAKGFKCKRCGHCCKEIQGGYTGSVDSNTILWWVEHKRFDILKYVERLTGDMWDYFINPKTGEDLNRCPFLRKKGGIYTCTIQDFKPPTCSYFPDSKRTAKKCDCKGFDEEGV